MVKKKNYVNEKNCKKNLYKEGVVKREKTGNKSKKSLIKSCIDRVSNKKSNSQGVVDIVMNL